ncbi:MAG TPA: phospholipid carrier-dependent glycosyltransferase, partial [Candidatus Limnocylindrales bacterium]
MEDGPERLPAGATAPAAAAGVPVRAPITPGTTGDPAPGDRPGSLVPAWFDRPSLADLGPLRWLRAKVAETPFRPDRSFRLRGEKGARLDRLDLWMVIVLVLAAMCLRTYRLSEPARMHFDEVYHARTATEFLQYWRYGISHDIYEWTHPHLAKYMMAAGIVAFAGHDVAASSNLGLDVRDAAIEPRFDDGTSNRLGDRVFVVTGSQLVAYDLETRKLEATWDIPGAITVTVDSTTHAVTVGTDTGALKTVDSTTLDDIRKGVSGAAPSAVSDLGTLPAVPAQLLSWDNGTRVAARLPDGAIDIVDASTGSLLGSTTLKGATDMAEMGSGDTVTATLASVTDAKAEATTLARITGGSAADYQKALETAGVDSVVLDVTLGSEIRTKLQDAISGGTLAGLAIAQAPLLAVADTAGVDMLADNAAISDRVPLGGGAFGLARVTGLASGDQLYVSGQDAGTPQIAIIATSGDPAKNGPTVTSTMEMPGAVTKILFDEAAQMVEALGKTPGAGDPTVYVIEPHGNAVFADHQLGFTPTALVMDHNELYPSSSRGQILAFSPSGETAALDIGHYDFSWRLPGVIFGALTVAAIYLLTRILFRRRLIAGLAGLFVLLDGMMFVQSRIAMNDVYVGFFIVAAYALFAWLWMEPRRRRWFWLLMPVIGVLLGLGLGSKWVAAYAIGALGILILARSALGRVVLILGMMGMTAVLGWMALAVPSESTGLGNVLFPLIMIALTLATVAITVYRPIAWSDDEIRIAVAGPAAAGFLLALAAIAFHKVDSSIAVGPIELTPLPVALALVVLGGVMCAGFAIGRRFGF